MQMSVNLDEFWTDTKKVGCRHQNLTLGGDGMRSAIHTQLRLLSCSYSKMMKNFTAMPS